MACQLFFLGVILLTGVLLLFIEGLRHKQAPFKPRTRVKGTDLQISPPTGMRAAADHSNQDIPRIGGRRRAGPVCFVTGMSRTACACRDCRNRREGR